MSVQTTRVVCTNFSRSLYRLRRGFENRNSKYYFLFACLSETVGRSPKGQVLLVLLEGFAECSNRKARQKTEVESLIPLHTIAEQILSLYTKVKSRGDYKIFPDTMSKGKLLNHLKAVGLACGIRTPLTYHIGRHSFGTMTLEAGIPMESITRE